MSCWLGFWALEQEMILKAVFRDWLTLSFLLCTKIVPQCHELNSLKQSFLTDWLTLSCLQPTSCKDYTLMPWTKCIEQVLLELKKEGTLKTMTWTVETIPALSCMHAERRYGQTFDCDWTLVDFTSSYPWPKSSPVTWEEDYDTTHPTRSYGCQNFPTDVEEMGHREPPRPGSVSRDFTS